MERAMEVAQEINQKADPKYSTIISPFIREPLINLSKQKNLQAPEEKFARLISHERFASSLRASFESTLSNIISLSTPPPAYIIIAGGEGKSANWVVAQTLDIMKIHPPAAIIDSEHLPQFLKNNPTIKHVVLMDDGSYSGWQADATLSQLSYSHPVSIHVCIPYMTKVAKERISRQKKQAAFYKNQVIFSKHQIMLSYSEMYKLGYFGYIQFPRPNVECLLSMRLIKVKNEYPENTKKIIKNLNSSIRTLKKEVFKKSDEDIMLEIKRIFLLLPSENDSREIFGEVRGQLETVQAMIPRFGHSKAISASSMERYARNQRPHWKSHPEIGSPEARTPVWMAHKSADGASTDTVSMKKATGNSLAISPYKESKPDQQGNVSSIDRAALIDALREAEKLSSPSKQTLDEKYASHRMGQEGIVCSNRGCFLIADNYREKLNTNENQLILVIDNIELPFGGKDGAFQYKLTDGLTFTLKKPNSDESKTFTYEKGALTLQK